MTPPRDADGSRIAPPCVARLLIADGAGFVTRSLERLTLTLGGIEGDRHAGPTRAADARTPWHRRGVRIANTRHLSIVSREECAEIAALLDIAEVDPALLGANLVLAGMAGLSLLPAATRLQFPSGATIFVTEQNAPCRQPAMALSVALSEPRLATAFVKVAAGRRGLVGLVEREGPVTVGDAVRCVVPATASPMSTDRREAGAQ